MDNTIDELVSLLAKEFGAQKANKAEQTSQEGKKSALPAAPSYTKADYPMLQKHGDVIKTPTGKSMQDLSLKAVLDGEIRIQDVRISKEMLYAQAEIAADAGKPQMGENLRRAAELIQVPDDVVIQMYNLLRPNRATAAQLSELAQSLRESYQAPLCAKLVEEAVQVYEKRKILIK